MTLLKEAHHQQAGFASPAYSLLVFASDEEAPKLPASATVSASCCHASLPVWTLTLWNHKAK